MLDLAEGVSVKVVAEKLGHANAHDTLNTYAHACEGCGGGQRSSAARCWPGARALSQFAVS